MPASFAFHCPATAGAASSPVTELALAQAQSCAFHVDALDAAGEVMQASAGFSIESADPAVVHVRPEFFFDFGFAEPDVPVTDADGQLVVAGAGSTTVAVRAGALSMSIPVSVE
jgi:hypothetical protein